MLLTVACTSAEPAADLAGWNEGSALRGEVLATGQRTLEPGGELLTHGEHGRARVATLQRALDQILAATVAEVDVLQADLTAALAGVIPPERLATNDPALRRWREDEYRTYREVVQRSYAEAERRLQGMYEAAVGAARGRAQMLAPVRSPLDQGLVGDPALDATLSSFEEVLSHAVGLDDFEHRREQDLQRGRELFEVFSTFGVEGVEERLAGRLLLFLGGDEAEGTPRALLVYRDDAGRDVAEFSFRQAVRFRVFRGPTLVSDLGWRLVPTPLGRGEPAVEAFGNCLLATQVEPFIDQTASSFDSLRDMRILADMQSALVGSDGLILGGVDWRLEFSVSALGALTWQLAGTPPAFQAACAEVARLLP
ncbi:MAG: hypothetical protein ACT4PU_00335 [Planctomycetota bacterium]